MTLPRRNITGKCLNCGAPVEIGINYCNEICGKEYRYRTVYAFKTKEWRQKRKAKKRQPRREQYHKIGGTLDERIEHIVERAKANGTYMLGQVAQ